MNQLAMVFKLDMKGFNLVRGVALLAVMLGTLAVLHAVDQEKYFLTVALAELFAGISDPGGEYGYRMSHMALFAVTGTLLTALGFGIGGAAWGWVVLAGTTPDEACSLAIRAQVVPIMRSGVSHWRVDCDLAGVGAEVQC